MADIWAWADQTAYVSADQAQESRRQYEHMRRNEQDEFAALVLRYCEYWY